MAPIYLFSDAHYSNELYQKALDSYNNRMFQDSYMMLQKYVKEGKLDKNTTFILARSAYEVGRFDEARVLYEQLLSEDPTNNRVKLELAQTYYNQKQFDDARRLYEDVLKDDSLPPSVRQNINNALANSEKRSQKNFFKTTLSVGFGYDSNVDNLSNDEYVYWGGIPLSMQNPKSDHFMEYVASVNHTYKLQDNISIDNKLVGFKQVYNKQKDNNLDIAILETGLSYYTKNAKYSATFDFNYVKLDSKKYLYNYIFTPSLDYKLDTNLLYRAKLKILRKDFKQKEYNFRDSTYLDLTNALSYLSENFGTNTLSIALGEDNKNSGSHYNVDYNFLSFRYDNIYPLTTNTLLSSGVEYYIDRYSKKEEVLYNNKKKNDKYVFDLGVLHSFSKAISLGATFRYINNHSNQNIYEYDKYVLKTNLYYSF